MGGIKVGRYTYISVTLYHTLEEEKNVVNNGQLRASNVKHEFQYMHTCYSEVAFDDQNPGQSLGIDNLVV